MKKLILFFCLFFLFDTPKIDSNVDKVLIYNKINIHDEGVFKIYFKNINSNELDNIINILNIMVLSYIIDGEKYYARNINELVDSYIEDKSLSEQIYYKEHGIYIDGINVKCEINELLKLENLTKIY